jgi:hypothetical protein
MLPGCHLQVHQGSSFVFGGMPPINDVFGGMPPVNDEEADDKAFMAGLVFDEDRESADGSDAEGGGSEQFSIQQQDSFGPGYESSEFASPPASPAKRQKPEAGGPESKSGGGRKKGSTNFE